MSAQVLRQPARPADTAAADPSLPEPLAPLPEVEHDLTVTALHKAYDGAKPILRGVNLTVRRGEAVALIGANGAGKSTLLRCCMRLIEPDQGRIRLLGDDVTHLRQRSLREVRARIGFVFQRHQLVPRLSALTNVVHGSLGRQPGPRRWFHHLAPPAVREEAMHCLDQVGLAHLALQRVDSLSGGQSQRVAIARALMQRPEFVMADEPVASLDPNAGEEVMQLFVELMRRQGISLLYTSHHLEHALRYADRVVGLRAGKVALDVAAAGQNANELRAIYD